MLRNGRTDLEALIGIELLSSDGEQLGKVVDVDGESFKVDAPFEPGYWLPLRTVVAVEADRVTLSFPKAELETYKNDEPAPV